MPYITREQRRKYSDILNELILRLKESNKVKGDANYCISTLLTEVFRPEEGWNYSSSSDVISVFECAKLEFYRRIVANVEDNAIRRNGDIRAYDSTGIEEF